MAASAAPSPQALLANSFNPEQQRLLLDLLRSGVSRNEVVSVLQAGTDEQWTALLKQDTKVYSGTRVVLSGGSGSKRKWNGICATVTKYPRSGAWMTVRVAGAGETNELKWRKGACRKQAPVAESSSYLVRLNSDLMIRVLSFLGGEEDPIGSGDDDNLRTLYVKDAGRLHTQIALVCRKLWQFCNESLRSILGRIDANMFGLECAEIIPCIFWMCKHRVRLGAFKIRADVADVPLLCRLLRECDTATMTEVEARLGGLLQAWSSKTSELISQAWLRENPGVDASYVNGIDLTGEQPHFLYVRRMARDLGVPFEENPNRKDLHDTIAQECPNLVRLGVNCRLPPTDRSSYRDWKRMEFSNGLFSLPRLQKLKVSFGLFAAYDRSIVGRSSRFNCNFITSFIKDLPLLEDLDIGTPMYTALCDVRLHIESETLRRLNVERLGKRVWTSCKCPNLERFVCNGKNVSGNGTRPDLTDDQLLALRGSDVVLLGTTPMVGMEVPDSCVFVLKDFQSYVLPFDVNNARNAIYLDLDPSDEDE